MGVYSDYPQAYIRHEETGGEAIVSAESVPHWEQLGWTQQELPDPDAVAEPEPEAEPEPPKKTRGRKADSEAESATTTTEEGDVNG